MEHKVLNLTEKGKFEDSDFGEVIFNDFDRAMDLRNYLGGNHVVLTETHPGYRIIRKDLRTHCNLLTGNAGTDTEHYIAYNYITDGDGFGRSIYCSSKTYKSFKGAAKKIRQYLDF